MADEVTKFDIQVMPIDERKAIIEDRKKKPEMELPFSELPNNPKLPVFYVPIELSIYRMQNARTRSWQQSYVKQDDRDPEFFKKGQENIEAQIAQHQRLWELSQEGNTQDQKSVSTALLESANQTEPLLITADGVIVNGNRRLAAMRELVGEVPAFSKVLVQLLPYYLDDKDLRRIEAKLQMAVDFRLKYEWTDQAQLAQDLLNDNNGDYEKVADILNNKAKDVKELIAQYEESQFYVSQVLKNANDFEYVNDRFQDFVQIAKAVRNVETTDEKEVIRALAWPLTKHAKDARRRVYEYDVVYTNTHRDATLEELAVRLEIDLDKPREVAVEDDLFEEPAANETSLARFKPVVDVLREQINNDAKSAEIATALRDIAEEFIELDKDRKTKSLALKKVRQAAGIIKSVKAEKADPETHAEILNALGILEASVQALRKIVEGLSGGA